MKTNYFLSCLLAFFFTATAFSQDEDPCASLDPIIESSEINICTGGDEVILEAELNSGNEIYWYKSAQDKDPIKTGSTYNIGKIESDVSYWVTEGIIDKKIMKGKGKQSYNGSFFYVMNGVGLEFEAEKEFTIIDVEVFSLNEAGEITIQLVDKLGNVFEEKKHNIPSGSPESPTSEVIPLNFDVPGKGYYALIKKTGHSTVRLGREMHSQASRIFPLDLGEYGKIIGGFNIDQSSEDAGIANNHLYFYNWTIEAESLICESTHKEIQIKVNDDFPETPNLDSTYILCGDQEFTFDDVIVADTNNLQWFDNIGDDMEGSTVIEEGVTYNVADKSPGGCLSDIIPITFVIQDISEQPIAEKEQTFEEDSNATLASLEVDGENLQWYADENKEEGLPEDTVLEDATTYYVTQTLENHCESEAVGISVTEILGVRDIVFENLKYNNPTQDILYLSNNEPIDEIILYDYTGKKIPVNVFKESYNNMEVNLSNLSQGIYLLNLKIKEENRLIKIIKN